MGSKTYLEFEGLLFISPILSDQQAVGSFGTLVGFQVPYLLVPWEVLGDQLYQWGWVVESLSLFLTMI